MKRSKIVLLVSVLSILCVLCVKVAKANNEFNPLKKAYLNAVAQYENAVAQYNALSNTQYNALSNIWNGNIPRYRNIGDQPEALDEEITFTVSYPRMTTGTSIPVTMAWHIQNPKAVDSVTIILLNEEGDEEGIFPMGVSHDATFTIPLQATRKFNTTPNTVFPLIHNYMLEVNFIGGEQKFIKAHAKLMEQYFVRPVL